MKGICHLASVPIRKAPESKSEIISMLLFGETFSINETADSGWTRITGDYDGYEGWISSRQFLRLESTVDNQAVVGTYPFLEADSPLGKIMIPSGSSLPGYKDGEYTINNETYSLYQEFHHFTVKDLENVARQYLNSPYLWGGRSPFGIDCSGFTQVIYKICGSKHLKRDAWKQAEQGDLIESRENAMSGDLAFFNTQEGRITHVGMLLSPNKIIHASGYVRIDTLDDFGILNEEEKKYTHNLRLIRRYIH